MKQVIVNLNWTVKPVGDTPDAVKANLEAQALAVSYFLKALEAQGINAGVNVPSTPAAPVHRSVVHHEKVIGPLEARYLAVTGGKHMRGVEGQDREETAKDRLFAIGQNAPHVGADDEADPLDGPSVAESQGAQGADVELSDTELLA